MNSTVPDYSVDDDLYNCLDLNSPQSFFLFAGAGSGKTRTLVEMLKRFRQNNVQRLRVNGQKVAIITYTLAACNEIKRRLEYDQAFAVSTIHSFSWELIKYHHSDIRNWLQVSLRMEIDELQKAQGRGRAGTKASEDRPRQIEAKQRRLASIERVGRFRYNPSGDNSTIDSLNHSEVIKITSDFLNKHPTMRSILVRKYPILLVDESQDTKKELMEALLKTQEQHANHFTLGLFGDTMQRIYSDGKQDLGQDIPSSWVTPSKTINYRSPSRVVALINKIRAEVDKHSQSPRENCDEGVVRLFIADTGIVKDKTVYERAVCHKMALDTEDALWGDPFYNKKSLTLEHHMAAQRGGFSDFFDPLYSVDKLRTGLLDGSLSAVSLLADKVLPLIRSYLSNDQFSVARIVRSQSPLLSKERLQSSQNQKDEINAARNAVVALCTLWKDDQDPQLISILRELRRSGLFDIPEVLVTIAERPDKQYDQPINDDADPVIDAWDKALQCPFSQFEQFARYVSDKSNYGTHQGIKGLEFPRVMVILDDEDARGFQFSYDKLFGAKDQSDTDIKNVQEGKETSIERTRRLFYVTCSRAQKSLAVIAYTKEPGKVRRHVLDKGWFSQKEIVSDLGLPK